MKTDIKIEFNNKEVLTDLIKKAYFGDNQMGRLSGKDNFIQIDSNVDNDIFNIINGLNNATIKVINSELIDGSLRFIIDDKDGVVKMYPVSIFCVFDNEQQRYYFY